MEFIKRIQRIMKETDWEKVYFSVLFLFVIGILIYKYITYGCIIMCGDWYNDVI
jgi:hypothetical protein